MATEAARLKRKNLLGGKTQTDLTLTGLLMEGLAKTARQQKAALTAGSVGERIKTRGTDGKPTQSLDGSGATCGAGGFGCCWLLVFRNCSETLSRFLSERAHAALLRALPPSRKATFVNGHFGFSGRIINSEKSKQFDSRISWPRTPNAFF